MPVLIYGEKRQRRFDEKLKIQIQPNFNQHFLFRA